MKQLINSIIITTVILLLTSCGKFGAATPCASQISIVPGECLSSSEMVLIRDWAWIVPATGINELYVDIDTDMGSHMQRVVLSRDKEFGFVTAEGVIPSDDIFAAFGDDADQIKTSYWEAFDNFGKLVDNSGKLIDSYEGGLISATTVYINVNDIVITADTEFAGVPAGENLASIAHITDCSYNFGSKPISDIIVPQSFFPFISTGLRLWFRGADFEGYSIVRDDVNLHIEIPVKVGLFLTMLRDRLTNPEAEMQYRDEVLTCDCHITHNIK